MKKSLTRAALALAAVCAVSQFSHAGDLDPKLIPADAKLVGHVDVAAGRDSLVWSLIKEQMKKDPNYEKNQKEIVDVLGDDYEKKIDGLDLYARSYAPTGIGGVVSGTIDTEKVKAKLKSDPTSKLVETYNGVDIYKPTEKEGQPANDNMFFCVPAPGKFAFAGSVDEVKAEVDLIAGKGETLAATSPLIQKPAKGTYLWVTADQINQEIPFPQMGPPPADAAAEDNTLDKVVMTAGDNGQATTLHAVADFRNAKGPVKVVSMVNMVKAMAAMQGDNPNMPPDQKLGMAIFNAVTATNQGNQATVDMSMTNEQIKTLAEQVKNAVPPPGGPDGPGPGGPGGPGVPPPPPPGGGNAPGGPL